MGKLIEANKEEIQGIIDSEQGLVLVDFHAIWCGPCKMLGPILEDVANEVEEVTILKVNVDENSELSTKYGIRNIPAVLAFRGGEVVDKFIGVKKKGEVVEFIKNLEVSNG